MYKPSKTKSGIKAEGRKSPINIYARMLNISQEGLRYYEQKGILKPDRNPQTGYRQYGMRDAFAVVASQKYRKYGFSLNQAVDLLRQDSHEKALNGFQTQEEKLQREIIDRQRILDDLKYRATRLKRALSSIGQYCIAERPALYWIPTRINGEVLEDNHAVSRIHHWNTMAPYNEFVAIWSKTQLEGGEGGTITVGHSLEVQRTDFLPVGESQFLASANCLFTAREVTSSDFLEETLFDSLLHAASQKGHIVIGEGVARLIRIYVDEQDTHNYLVELWLPIASESLYVP